MPKYFNHKIKKTLIVQNLLTIEYLDVSSNFSYPEETHNFFEFTYIDSGSIFCHCANETIELNQGEFFLIPPQKKHFYEATKTLSASILIVCFQCDSKMLSILDRKIVLSNDEKTIIADIFQESKNAFIFPFKKKLKLVKSPLLGAQQLVENNIEKLLINLIRNETKKNSDIKFVMNDIELKNNLVNDLIAILKNNLYHHINLDEICKQMYYSKTFLNEIFKENTKHSIMKYYTILKIQEAKKLLRDNAPVVDVSNKLQFESPTYFTKVFKKHTGLTPTEYKKTIL